MGGADLLDAHARRRGCECGERVVAIVKEIARSCVFRKRLAELLREDASCICVEHGFLGLCDAGFTYRVTAFAPEIRRARRLAQDLTALSGTALPGGLEVLVLPPLEGDAEAHLSLDLASETAVGGATEQEGDAATDEGAPATPADEASAAD